MSNSKENGGARRSGEKKPKEHIYANTNPDVYTILKSNILDRISDLKGTITKTVTAVIPDAQVVTNVKIISERQPTEDDKLKSARRRPGALQTGHHFSVADQRVGPDARGMIYFAGRREGQIPAGVSNVATLLPIEQVAEMQTRAKKTSITTENNFLQDAILAHNEFRGRHGVGNVTLDIELCKVAQSWANKISMAGTKAHSMNGYGECIFWRPYGPVNGRDPVSAWYDEGKYFNWKNLDIQAGTNNFTQLIWKSSTKVGIAIAAGGHGVFVVANYNPPGNIKGQFRENVLPLRSSLAQPNNQ